jgi:hypothetical protein
MKNSVESPKQRRSKLLLQREYAELREKNGKRLVDALAYATKTSISLADFNADVHPPYFAIWTGRELDTPGLVTAYVSKNEATSLASCIARRMPLVSGFLGYHEKDYFGLCEVSDVDIIGMVSAAEIANESVVFYPIDESGVVLVDCYEGNPGGTFTVIVQGEKLVCTIRECFGGKMEYNELQRSFGVGDSE